MIGYWDLFPGLYYYRLVTRIISDTLTTNGFGHRFILLAWKYCLFSFLHFKSQILIRKVLKDYKKPWKLNFSNFWLFSALRQAKSFRMIPMKVQHMILVSFESPKPGAVLKRVKRLKRWLLRLGLYFRWTFFQTLWNRWQWCLCRNMPFW